MIAKEIREYFIDTKSHKQETYKISALCGLREILTMLDKHSNGFDKALSQEDDYLGLRGILDASALKYEIYAKLMRFNNFFRDIYFITEITDIIDADYRIGYLLPETIKHAVTFCIGQVERNRFKYIQTLWSLARVYKYTHERPVMYMESPIKCILPSDVCDEMLYCSVVNGDGVHDVCIPYSIRQEE